jgi:predicted Zn-dependent protease
MMVLSSIQKTLQAAAFAVSCLVFAPAISNAQGLSVIRDAEIEQLLRDYAGPIFKAAGINAGATKIILIGDRRFNAFVADGRKMFINIGSIMDSDTPNQLIGVIAHESGHIAGGHLARLRGEVARAQILSVIGTLLGAAAVGGAMASGDNVGISGNAAAIAIGPQELIRRNLLAYQRSEEQAADRAALNYLEATGQSGRGMIQTFERFANEGLFASAGADPYTQSHPMAPDRIANVSSVAQSSPYFDRADPAGLQTRHNLARAKLFGFVGRFDEVQRRFPPGDNNLAARYARAIAQYRAGRLDNALVEINALIKSQPKNPFFWELKGQALLEGGRAEEAVGPLRQAVKIAPAQHLIRGLLAQALVATGSPKNIEAAIKEARAALGRDREATDAWRTLARAYGLQGDQARADLATAEAYMISGRKREGISIAKRAQSRFKEGTPDWLRADDIVNSGREE